MTDNDAKRPVADDGVVMVSLVVREHGKEPVEYVHAVDRRAQSQRTATAFQRVADLEPGSVGFGDLLWNAAQAVMKHAPKPMVVAR